MQFKSSSSSTSSPSMKLKTIIQNLLAHPLYRFLRAVSRAKSIFLEISKHNNKKRKLTILFIFLSLTSMAQNDESQLSGYLEWLEHKKVDDLEENRDVGEADDDNDIDHLADMFIANCHEKFLLEKVESYRRSQEMLERSL
ncbi:hypothetical protein Rs2_18848 [Raphanus sativus]|nr:hypothetical protein Rs2_18848 [Raphanus sativus]